MSKKRLPKWSKVAIICGTNEVTLDKIQFPSHKVESATFGINLLYQDGYKSFSLFLDDDDMGEQTCVIVKLEGVPAA